MSDKRKSRREYMRAYMQKLRQNPSFRETEKEEKRLKRAKQKYLREKAKEQELERHLRENPFDLNFGLRKPKLEPFMSWSEYKQIFENATFKMYLKDKQKFLDEQKVRPLKHQPNITSSEQQYKEGVRNRSEKTNIF